MYLGKGIAQAGNEAGHEPGGKHSMLVFLASYRDDYDWNAAEAIAAEKGWRNVEFTKAGKVTREQMQQQDRVIRACFDEALGGGSSMVVYAGVENR